MTDSDRTDERFVPEIFSPSDLMTLRNDLLQAGLDTFQAGEILTSFLSGHGFGISSQEARSVASTIERIGPHPNEIHAELERVARVM